jgi:hypothetical protein
MENPLEKYVVGLPVLVINTQNRSWTKFYYIDLEATAGGVKRIINEAGVDHVYVFVNGNHILTLKEMEAMRDYKGKEA